LKRGKLPIVVGGSGLYIRSLIDGFFEGPGADPEFRTAMESHVKDGRLVLLLDELKRIDPESAARIDPTKPRRVIRALEVHHSSGKPFSQLQKESKVEIEFLPVMVGLRWQRVVLYRRIEERCDRMIEKGLFSEVENLRAMGFDDSLNALKTVGYAEAFAYARGEISYNEFVRSFKQNSRRYAKRQMTWFRKDTRIRWIEMNEERSAQDAAREIASMFPGATSVDSDRE
jgi:tRNA dimethylallyltransferase